MNPKVTVYTQIYNTKPYLPQCIESVLNQTYSELEYIIVDNGCTDGSSELLQDYAEQDKRIHLIRYEENQRGFWWKVVREIAAGQYVTLLDSDDWWEPNYLETLVSIAEETDADMVCTGTRMHIIATGETSERSVAGRLILAPKEYAPGFPYYHAFLRTTWGKVFRMRVFRKAEIPDFAALGLTYGGDTLSSFAVLRKANRLVIDNSVLHHYRIHPKSVSYQYTPSRFDSDVYLHNDALDFLSAYGPISEQNRKFLAAVYANAVNDTVHVIYNAKIPKEEKLHEYRRIAEHPVTNENFAYAILDVERARKELAAGTLACLGAKNAKGEASAVLAELMPKCGAAFTAEYIPLLTMKPELMEAMLNDDAEALLCTLLNMVRANEQSKKFDLVAMVAELSADKLLLKACCEKKFLRHYSDIFLAVWREQYAEALDQMTGKLLEGEKVDETFLQLYLSLAALQNQVEAFVFGKLCLARFFMRKGMRTECQNALSELAEMGVVDDDEISEMKAELRSSEPTA